MKFSHMTAVSSLALALALAAPAYADQAAGQATDDPAAAAAPGTGATAADTTQARAQDAVSPRLSLDALMDTLGEIGVEDRELFAGTVIRARSDDGDPVIMLIGPEGFDRGEVATLEGEEFDGLRDQLTEAGFDQIDRDHQWQIVQGSLDDHEVLAASGGPEWGEDMQRAMPTGMDRDSFEERLGDAGIEDRDGFEGKLVRARTAEGESLVMLIGTDGFEGGESVELGDDDLRQRFEDAGLQNFQVVEENIYITRGSYDDKSILALSGSQLMDDPVATGTVSPATEQPQLDDQTGPEAAPEGPDLDTPEEVN